jgi:hypothetical protein
MSPYNEEGFWVEEPSDVFTLPEVAAYIPSGWETNSDPFAPDNSWLASDVFDRLASAPDVFATLVDGAVEESARLVAAAQRPECLSVRLPGVPGAEYLATAADWWAQQAVDQFGTPVRALGQVNDSINSTIQNTLGISGGPSPADATRPKARAGLAPGDDGFLVKVPDWRDIFQLQNDPVFGSDDKAQRTADAKEALARSPTPPALQEIGELLTTLDDVQDEAATLAIVLMIAEKLAGRAIPGVGWVTTAADALNVIYALSSKATGSSLPGKRGKRAVVDKAKASPGGLTSRLEEMRRSGALKIGVGDILQALQATDSMFGVGIQIGGVMGFLQDSFWGGVRGAEFEARGPIWDPLGFTEYGRSACYRSPSIDEIHPKAYFALSHTALSVWKKSARLMPYVDQLGEPALASMLTGLRMSEQVLGPWLRSGVWVDPLVRAMELTPYVAGGVEAHDTRHLKPDQWLKHTVPGAIAATRNAIANVSDRGRQALYGSMVSSIGWGFTGSMEPGAHVMEQQLSGPIKDAFTLLEANKIPVFDLDD